MKIGDYCYLTYKDRSSYIFGKICYIDKILTNCFSVDVIISSRDQKLIYREWVSILNNDYIVSESIDGLGLNKKILNKFNKALKMIVFS